MAHAAHTVPWDIVGVILSKLGLRHMIRRPFLTLLCVLGVSLGVAVIIAIDLANSSASRAFRISTDAISGRATHQVVSASGTIDEALFARVKAAGIREAAPVIDAFATSVELDMQPIRIVGVDVFNEAPFRNYLVQQDASIQRADFSQFISVPDTVVLGEEFATRYGLKRGDALAVRAGGRQISLTIVGLLSSPNAANRRALDGMALVDIGTAQRLFEMPGQISHIDLIADERTAEGRAVLDRVGQLLPAGVRAIKPEARSNSVESLSDAFELNLTALSLLALVVGIFLIYNSITFSVVQRRPIFGMLRCIGVTRREIFEMVLREALWVGVVGGALGVVAGIILGRGAVRLVTQTINDLYYVVTVRDVELPAWVLLKGFLMGVAAALVAAVAPALEATFIPPVNALKRSDIESRVHRVLPLLALAGLASGALGLVLLFVTPALAVNLGGIFAIVLGAALVSPLAALAAMRILQRAARRVGSKPGAMAARAVAYSLSRTGVAVASLMVAISVIIGLQGMIESFRTTVARWLQSTLVADVYIRSAGSDANPTGTFMLPDTVRAIRSNPAVESVNVYRRATARFSMGRQSSLPEDLSQAILIAQDTDAVRDINTMKWTDLPGGWRDQWRALEGRDDVIVSEPFANRFGATPHNNLITLATDDGPRVFQIRGIFFDYGSDQGVVMMRRDLYRKFWRDDKVSSMALFLKPGAGSVGDNVDMLRRVFAGEGLAITANAELRENALGVFDRTFAITGALNLLAMLVAFIGVLSALMALLVERTHEFGIMRATGFTLPQLARLVLTESAYIGATAGLLSIPTGFALAVILIRIINLRAFGWTIELNMQPGTLLQAFAIAVGSALLAAIYPMLRLRNLQIAQAVRQE